MAHKFDEALNECIERLLRGESLEDCLGSHPELAQELEPLLRTAAMTHRATSVEARPEFKARLRYEIAARANSARQPAVQKTPLQRWAPRWAVAIVSVCLLFVLAGGSTVAAASTSIPGDTLYSVKTTSERMWLAATFSDVGKARLQARFAQRRVREMARLIERGNTADLQTLSAQFNAHLADLGALAVEIRQADPDATQIAQLQDMLESNMDRDLALLEEVESGTSPETWPAIELARNRLANSYQDAFNALAGKQGSEGEPGSGSGDTSGTGSTDYAGNGGSGYGSMPKAGGGPAD